MARKRSTDTSRLKKEKGFPSEFPSDKKTTTSSQTKHCPPLPWYTACGILMSLLILPIWAVLRSSFKNWIVIYLGVISGLTFVLYWSDKRKAWQNQWRVSEGTLHLLEALGGWPMAYFSQRILRHKTKKRGYQISFWLIVATHQILAFEVVTNCRISRLVWGIIWSKIV